MHVGYIIPMNKTGKEIHTQCMSLHTKAKRETNHKPFTMIKTFHSKLANILKIPLLLQTN